ncbi:MAG: polysaccharide deacetylase family protein [Treponema sp.]|nr:polysaccharide deacetylase family protein [Treponema sp.]
MERPFYTKQPIPLLITILIVLVVGTVTVPQDVLLADVGGLLGLWATGETQVSWLTDPAPAGNGYAAATEDPAEYEEPDPARTEAPKDNGKPMIALTFDDGPSRYTDRILDLLEKHGGRATFFVLGNRVESWQDTIIRAVNIGSEIAGHSWSHPELTRLNDEQITQEIRDTSAIIEQVAGVSGRFFRPPFGRVDEQVVNVSNTLGYSIVNWTLDTQDWKHRNANSVYNAIMRGVQEGSIVLMHDIRTTTATAMERVIPALIAKGYQLVTVSELLHSLYGELEPGRVYGIPGMR